MLLPLIDGGILEVHSDSEGYPGCETCDYGSQYINQFEVEMTTGKIKIEVSQEYEHALSEGSMMEIVLPNVDEIKKMTEYQFFEWLEGKTKEKIKEETYDFYDKDIKIEFIKCD